MRHKHTITIEFSVQSNAPERGADFDVTRIQLDGEDLDESVDKYTADIMSVTALRLVRHLEKE